MQGSEHTVLAFWELVVRGGDDQIVLSKSSSHPWTLSEFSLDALLLQGFIRTSDK